MDALKNTRNIPDEEKKEQQMNLENLQNQEIKKATKNSEIRKRLYEENFGVKFERPNY